MSTAKIAITPGEPAGIGPDLVVKLAQQDWDAQLVVFADPNLLKSRAQQLNHSLTLTPYEPGKNQLHQPGSLQIVPTYCASTPIPGQLDSNNGNYVIDTLTQACQHNIDGDFDAVVTGPVHKGVINRAGISFSGHTEFFAQQSNTTDVVMMLATEGLNVALVTTHIPLAFVSKAITRERLQKVIRILDSDLKTKFAINKPKIYVCGLNPHAGEDGHLGNEEIETISPALEELRTEGLDLTGPLPADTIFQAKYLEKADTVLAMYHDQGLPVLKYKGFGNSVNITLGLPFIRTSVDHGTALDLAGTGSIDTGSFQLALNKAIELARKQQ